MIDRNRASHNVPSPLRPASYGGAAPAAQTLRAGLAAIGRGVAAYAAARARRRLRRQTVRQLRRLPDRILRDIGIPRSQIWAVAEDLVNGAARLGAPVPAPAHCNAANRNRPEARRHLAVPTVAGCG